MEEETHTGKRFRIWLKQDMNNRKYCQGNTFNELLSDITCAFSLSNYDNLELRNGLDGTIIDSDFAFSLQKNESILVVFNKSNDEQWDDSIGLKCKQYSPGYSEDQAESQPISITNPKYVVIGDKNVISEKHSYCDLSGNRFKNSEDIKSGRIPSVGSQTVS